MKPKRFIPQVIFQTSVVRGSLWFGGEAVNFRCMFAKMGMIVCLILGDFFAHRLQATDAFQFSARSAPELDAVFQRTNGWIGADGAFSTGLSPGTTLWLFSDTWLGEVREGKRIQPKLIHNSIALQQGTKEPNFFYRLNPQGEAEAFVKPLDGKGYFWLFAATRTKSGLYIFLRQTVTTDTSSVFGFKMVGTWLGWVANPDEPPLRWKIQQQKIPFTTVSTNESITFGSAVVKHERHLYIFGNRWRRQPAVQGMIVARVPEDRLGKFSAWRFWANGAWQKDFRVATPVFSDAPSEASVFYEPGLQKFVFTFSRDIRGKIDLRTASTLVGPWSEATTVYECPEMAWSPKVFCYAAKAHPQLAANPGELIITYAANSHNFFEVIKDARLYWPRFVRVNLTRP